MAARTKPKDDAPQAVDETDDAEVPEAPESVPLDEQRSGEIEEADPGPMHPGFVRVFNHETGGVGDVPEDLVGWWSAKGWTIDPNPPEPTTESQED